MAAEKKPTRKKTTQKKATRKNSAEKKEAPRRSSAPRAESRPASSPAKIARQAAEELLELTGKEPEGIIGLEKADGRWTVQVEVIEVRRIPNTTDVLALYEVETDSAGALQSYRRVRRYARGASGEQ